MHRSLRALGLTRDKKEMSLWLILKILRIGLYSLRLALLIYIGIIYILICLNLINTRLLIRPSAVRFHLEISTKILLLLLTGYIAALTCLRSTCLWIYL